MLRFNHTSCCWQRLTYSGWDNVSAAQARWWFDQGCRVHTGSC